MIRSPSDQDRTIILGRTGSGKSQFACALFSTRDFDVKPWVIIDYKGEDLIADIIKACKGEIKSISPTANPPKSPGIYHMRPMPVVDDNAVNDFLWKCHKQGNIGLFIDEGYTLPQKNGNAFDVILTQGRSLHIPVIILYQRPVWMSRFAIAQASYFAIFEQNDLRDLKITEQFIKPMKVEKGQTITVYSDLPRYYCLWYDVSQGKTSLLQPAPSRNEIINAFKRRLLTRKKRAFV